jgi:aminomethyltransferase
VILARSFRRVSLKRTPLFALHEAQGAKMCEYGGYEVPIEYDSLSITKSVLHTRAKCSLFDVSHMPQMLINSKLCNDFIEGITTVSAAGLKIDHSALSIFSNDAGGIIEDLIITRTGDDQLRLIGNAANKDKDILVLQNHLEKFVGEVEVKIVEDSAILALQGPEAKLVLSELINDVNLNRIPFMGSFHAKISGMPVYVTRCGYTGEDGFEIAVDSVNAIAVAEELLNHKSVIPAGLAARDILRIEAGLCLYGHDIDESTTPIEAGLSWIVHKKRREHGGFPGDSVILQQLREGIENESNRKRVGFLIDGPLAREGAAIYKGEAVVGGITSGNFSPHLNKPISMGYVKGDLNIGDEVEVLVRENRHKAKICKLPFLKTKYYSIS